MRSRFERMEGLLIDVFVVVRCFDFFDFGVKTVFVIGSVLDNTSGTIGFHQTVRAFDVAVSIALFVLAFDVVRVRVFNAVFKMVRCGGVCVVMVFVDVVFEIVVFWRESENQVSQQGGGGAYDQLKYVKQFSFLPNVCAERRVYFKYFIIFTRDTCLIRFYELENKLCVIMKCTSNEIKQGFL